MSPLQRIGRAGSERRIRAWSLAKRSIRWRQSTTPNGAAIRRRSSTTCSESPACGRVTAFWRSDAEPGRRRQGSPPADCASSRPIPGTGFWTSRAQSSASFRMSSSRSRHSRTGRLASGPFIWSPRRSPGTGSGLRWGLRKPRGRCRRVGISRSSAILRAGRPRSWTPCSRSIFGWRRKSGVLQPRVGISRKGRFPISLPRAAASSRSATATTRGRANIPLKPSRLILELALITSG